MAIDTTDIDVTVSSKFTVSDKFLIFQSLWAVYLTVILR